MKRNSLFITLLAIFFCNLILAQSGVIRGMVSDAANQPLPGVNILIKKLDRGGVSDAEGKFMLADLPTGEYILEFSYIGYNALSQRVSIIEGQVTELNIVLKEGITLQAVEIIGRSATTYNNEASFSGTKTATLLKDIPQSISYVTKEVIADQQAIRLGEVVKNVSGVNQFSFYDDFTLRGFRSDVQLINGLRVTSGFWKQPLTFNLERVEVIKGPASALFGNTNPGGTINRVTKKPLSEKRQAVSFTTGSFNTYRASADFTGPFTQDKKLLYRLNLGYENAQSFRDLQDNRNIVIAPSISFIPNQKTRVNFDMVYNPSRSKLDRGQPIFGASAGTDLNSTPISFAIQQANDYLNEDNLFVTASLTHDFSECISFNASYMKFFYSEDLMEHRTSNRFAVTGDGAQIPTLMEMQVIRRLRQRYVDNLTTYFVTKFNTGTLSHQLLVGYDHIREEQPVGGANLNARGYRNAANNGVINAYNPAQKERYLLDANGNPVPNVPHFDLTNPNAYTIAQLSDYFTTTTPIAPTLYYVNGVYVQDQIKFGKIEVLLGLRQEFYTDLVNFECPTEESVRQDKLLPRIGLVYGLTNNINLYGTYVQGYMPQGTAALTNPAAGGPFDPLTSEMFELGAKGDFLNRRLSAYVAVYQIEQNNILINAQNPENPDLLEQRGQESSRGIEFEILGQVTPNLSIIANYAYSKAEITESDDETQIGLIKENAPEHQGGFWAKYSFLSGTLSGIGVAVGGNFVSERNTFDPRLQLPSYFLWDAALFYKVDKFRLSVNFNNLTNKTHWVGGYDFVRLFPGAPRNFLATVAYEF